jgi:hypothetical protein
MVAPQTARAAPAFAGSDPENSIMLVSEIDWSRNPVFRVKETHPRPALRLVVDNTVPAAYRIYEVRPCPRARPDIRADLDWSTYYVVIRRLSDGARTWTWKTQDWEDSDSWAHAQWDAWRRQGWHAEWHCQ